jgi:hypothetical protein
MVDGRDASAAHADAANFRDEMTPKADAPCRSGESDFARVRSVCSALSIALASACIALIFVGSAAASGAPRLHLRGIARIDAHVARAQGKLVLTGTVTDDLGAAAPHARIGVEIGAVEASGTGGAQSGASLLPLSPMTPEACSDAWQGPALEDADRALAVADGAGRFCVRLAVPTGRYVAHVEVKGSGLVDGASVDLPVDLALEPVTLRFDPERNVLSLDDESTTVDVIASTEDDGITSAAMNLPLTLSNESGRALGSATTNSSGRARFVVRGALFGSPGKGELRVSFAGSAQAGASSYASAVERRTRVDLELPQAVEGRLPLATSEREVAVHVVAKTNCASQGCSGTPTGTIEARVGVDGAGGFAAAAPLVKGEARVVLTFATPSDGDGDTPVRLEFVPDTPWFETGAPLQAAQPLQPPAAWDQLLLWLTGLGVVVWLAAGRLPPRWDTGEPTSSGTRVFESAAHVELLSAGSPNETTWNGRVVDGHEGIPLAGVRVALERPGFERAEIVADTTSGPNGAFVLAPVEVKPGDRLMAEGPLHGVHRTPAPPFGEVRVVLVSRRRALLDRLVGWARRKGRPYDAHPEPTPGHVQRMARSGDEARAWAEAVERAAYSGDAIDAQREAEVDRLAPGDAPPAPGPGNKK